MIRLRSARAFPLPCLKSPILGYKHIDHYRNNQSWYPPWYCSKSKPNPFTGYQNGHHFVQRSGFACTCSAWAFSLWSTNHPASWFLVIAVFQVLLPTYVVWTRPSPPLTTSPSQYIVQSKSFTSSLNVSPMLTTCCHVERPNIHIIDTVK